MAKSKSSKKDRSQAIPLAVGLRKSVDADALEQDLHNNLPVSKRVFFLSLQAIINAIIIGFIAKGLVWLINLITNISFYGKFSIAGASPAGNHIGWLVLIVPIIGGIIVGIMARFGSAAIRGHGLPEAIEQVLINQSRIKPIVTFLKPISSAIAIGTGGPFGAEGPIIATGGAFGSFAGQLMRVTASERKIILTAGATAGMAAIFGSPVSSVLLAIELLLFEFSPRSVIPVALSCATAAAMHYLLFEPQPVFMMKDIPEPTYLALIVYTLLGVIIGVVAAYVSKSVYLAEDFFMKLPIHWMWWPALGAIAVGVIGYFAPSTMGVGYENIRLLLAGKFTWHILFVLGFLKFVSWSVSLGSGTAGGTLAPLFTMGGALGGALGLLTLHFFPGCQINLLTAVMVGMAAMFAGAARALLTAIIFLIETTGQIHGLLPLLGACTSSYFVSFFLMRGSIMTEKIERRGVHTPVAYQPDVLEKILVGTVMDKEIQVLSEANTIHEAREWLKKYDVDHSSTHLVVVDESEKLSGIILRKDIFDKRNSTHSHVTQLIGKASPHIFPDNILSVAVDLMDKYDMDVLPVVDREDKRKLLGILTYKNIFAAYRMRQNEDLIYKQEIAFHLPGMKIIKRGREFFKWQR